MYVLISVTNKLQEGSYATHDNVNKFDTFFALMAIGAGNSPVTSEFSAQGQWRGASMFSLICAWINVLVNNVETGDLKRQRAHYDVTVIITASLICYTHTYHVQLCSLSTQHVACWEKNVILLYTLMSISICNSVIAQRLRQKFWLLDFNERYGNIYIYIYWTKNWLPLQQTSALYIYPTRLQHKMRKDKNSLPIPVL